VKAESYVNGQIDISNKFSQESFNYSSTSVTFYHDLYDDTEIYSFEKDLLKVDDFNGLEKEYQIILNDYILIGSEINAGSVFSTITMDFYDTEGQMIHQSTMQISIQFLSNKTQLSLATTGESSAKFLEQYFADNGIRLRILEIL